MNKKYVLRRKLTSNSILLAVAASAFCGLPGVTLAEVCNLTTNWTGSNSSWFIDSNWDDDVPNSNINAFINNAGTANVGSAEHAEACDLFLGFGATESGTVSVNGGRLTVANELEVGGDGQGTLALKNGATASAKIVTIAALPNVSGSGSTSTVSIDAASLTIDERADVGGDNGNQGGVALLSVTNGGSVTVTAPAPMGYLRVYPSGTLTGNGSLSTTNGMTIAGTLTPSGGTLTVQGNLTFSGTVATMECHVVPNSADNVNVSGVASLAGKISVTMTGSTFTAGTRYTLLLAGGGIDPNHPMFQFNSIKGGSGDCFTPIITYDASNVYLYLSPCSN